MEYTYQRTRAAHPIFVAEPFPATTPPETVWDAYHIPISIVFIRDGIFLYLSKVKIWMFGLRTLTLTRDRTMR